MRNTTIFLLITALIISLSLSGYTAEIGAKARLANNEIDFGKVKAGESDTKTLKIENKGDQKLEITKLTSNSPSIIPTIAEKIIEPGKSADIEVKFDSKGIDPCILIKYVYVYTNDPELKDRSLPITCKVVVVPVSSPLIQLMPYELDLGIVNPGEPITRTITYGNVGTANLEVEPIQFVGNPFVIKKNISARSLPPDGTGSFEIAFEGKEPGKINTYVLVKSNTIGGPFSKVAIKGEIAEKNISIGGIEIAKDEKNNPKKPEQYSIKINNYFAPYKVKATVLNGKQKGKTFDINANTPHMDFIELDPAESGKVISLQLDIILEEPKIPAVEEKKPEESTKTGEENKPEEKAKSDEGDTKAPDGGEKEKAPEEKEK